MREGDIIRGVYTDNIKPRMDDGICSGCGRLMKLRNGLIPGHYVPGTKTKTIVPKDEKDDDKPKKTPPGPRMCRGSSQPPDPLPA